MARQRESEQNRSLRYEVLRLLAMAGDAASRSLLLHAFPRSQHVAAFETVREACIRGVLKESSGGAIEFGSQHTRSRIVGELTGDELAKLNLAVARALESRDGTETESVSVRAAVHYGNAVPLISPETAADRCLAAGRLLLSRAQYEPARDILERGLDLVGRSQPSRLQADLLATLGRVLLATISVWGAKPAADTLDAAITAYAAIGELDQALEIAGLPLPAVHGRDQTIGLLEKALRLSEDYPQHAALIRIRLARAYLLERADRISAMRAVDDAVEQATSIGREDLRLRAVAARAFISVYAMQVDEAERDAMHVLHSATSDPERLAELDACESMVSVCMLRGDAKTMYEIGARMAAAGEWTRNPVHVSLGQLVQGRTRMAQGDLESAVAHFVESNRLQPDWPVPIGLLARIAYLRGADADFRRWRDALQALELPDRAPQRLAIGFSPSVQWVEVLLDIGEMTGEKELIDRARLIVEPPALGTGMPLQQMASVEPAARIALVDRDSHMIRKLDEEYRSLYGDRPPFMRLRTAGLLAFHAGDRRRGERILRFGTRYCEERGLMLWVLQLTDTLLGVSGGNRTTPSNASIALARRAVDIAKRIGVVNGIDSVRSTLDRSPRSHFARSGESALTRREREVLSLISKGRSNRQIADELFVNPNTVDTHVRNIFLKLGVNSRAEAAQKSARMNLD